MIKVLKEIARTASIDPPESDASKIKAALEKWQKNQEDEIANSPDPSKRKELKAEFDRLMRLLKEENAWSTPTKWWKTASVAIKDERCKRLNIALDLIKESGKGSFYGKQIEEVSRKMNLSEKTVERIYQEKGIAKPKKSDFTDCFLSDTIFSKISDNLQRFKSLKSEYAKANDLYLFLETLFGIKDSKEKNVAEIESVLAEKVVDYAMANQEDKLIVRSLISIAKANVFCSEENRKKYNESLKRATLNAFLAPLRELPESIKKYPLFADVVVKKIQKTFPDVNLALYVYNLEMGLRNDPYEPEIYQFSLSCAQCGSSYTYYSVDEARKTKCVCCDAPLFVNCPKCRTSIPASTTRCRCGFPILESSYFNKHVQEVEEALRLHDVRQARRALFYATNSYPGAPKINALKQQIDAEEKKLEKERKEEEHRNRKEYEKIRQLIEVGKISAAQDGLRSFREKYSNNDWVRRLEAQIDDRFQEARRTFSRSCANLKEKIDLALGVLGVIDDYEPALEFLKKIPLSPVDSFIVTPCDDRSCLLQWNRSGDSKVAYRIVRKAGKVPQTPTDGEILVDDLRLNYYKDERFVANVRYGYAVFVKRFDVFSKPTTFFPFVTYEEPSDVAVETASTCGSIIVRWEVPPSCRGVRVLRRENDKTNKEENQDTIKIVDFSLKSSCEDKNVKPNALYYYRVQAFYEEPDGLIHTQGVETSVVNAVYPAPVSNVVWNYEGNVCSISWNSEQNASSDVEARVYLLSTKTRAQDVEGKFGELNTLQTSVGAKGRWIGNQPVTKNKLEIQLPSPIHALAALVLCNSSKFLIVATKSLKILRPRKIEKKRFDGSKLILTFSDVEEKTQIVTTACQVIFGESSTSSEIKNGEKTLSFELGNAQRETRVRLVVTSTYRIEGDVIESEKHEEEITQPGVFDLYYSFKESRFRQNKQTKLILKPQIKLPPKILLEIRNAGRFQPFYEILTEPKKFKYDLPDEKLRTLAPDATIIINDVKNDEGLWRMHPE